MAQTSTLSGTTTMTSITNVRDAPTIPKNGIQRQRIRLEKKPITKP